jgi:rubrerythrin
VAAAIRQVAAKGNADEMLAMAIQMEKDAMRFYSALPKALAETAEVQAVIREEQTHLRLLSALRGLGVVGP